MMSVANSDHLLPILSDLVDAGFPGNPESLNAIGSQERGRIYYYYFAQLTRTDNLIYQHDKGLIEDEYYEVNIRALVSSYGEAWKQLGMFGASRTDFQVEVDRILQEAS